MSAEAEPAGKGGAQAAGDGTATALSYEQARDQLTEVVRRLEGLSPEERLKGLSPEELRATVEAAQRSAIFQLAALEMKILAGFIVAGFLTSQLLAPAPRRGAA